MYSHSYDQNDNLWDDDRNNQSAFACTFTVGTEKELIVYACKNGQLEAERKMFYLA